jgi:hypothetical protein
VPIATPKEEHSEAMTHLRKDLARPTTQASGFEAHIESICRLDWDSLDRDDLLAAARAYYYFSIQFRENLEAACALFPQDSKLLQLRREECNTDNLSPWPGIASPGERMDHDEFMRRAITLDPLDSRRSAEIDELGLSYLREMRELPEVVKALTIASYEDGGLESVFRAILRARNFEGRSLQAFRHFLVEHIRFDSDPDAGHGALSRHLVPDARIAPAWAGFERILVRAVPRLLT